MVALVGYPIEGAIQRPGAEAVFGRRGVALTPANFPRHSTADVENMFKLARELGSSAVFIYQWSQPDFVEVATKTMDASRAAGLVPILGLSPTTLDFKRGELDLPPAVRKAAGRRPSFSQTAVRQAYIRDATALAKLQPPYLCLATEINLLALADLEEFLWFARFYREELHPLIKKTSPGTKVFVSFQWDVIRMMGVKEPTRIREHTRQLEVFRPQLDVAAFTSYPSEMFASPAEMPSDYYEAALQHVRRNEEVMFMEIGWPSSGRGTEREQVAFIDRLPSLMATVKPSLLAWSLLHDVRGSALGSGDLATTGLADSSGRRKPAFDAFKQLR